MSSGTERIVMPRAAADATLARYVRNGKLAVIPARRNGKLVIFAWLAGRFEQGRRYSEAEVNAELREAHLDVATLRRGMYDEFFLDRAEGEYWRTPESQKISIVD
jgi:hypothetical protein